MGKVGWLESFFENQKSGVKCTCCSDCDRERDAAQREIERLRSALRWLARNDANGWIKDKVKETLQ